MGPYVGVRLNPLLAGAVRVPKSWTLHPPIWGHVSIPFLPGPSGFRREFAFCGPVKRVSILFLPGPSGFPNRLQAGICPPTTSQSPSCRGRQGSSEEFLRRVPFSRGLNPLLAGAVRVPVALDPQAAQKRLGSQSPSCRGRQGSHRTPKGVVVGFLVSIPFLPGPSGFLFIRCFALSAGQKSQSPSCRGRQGSTWQRLTPGGAVYGSQSPSCRGRQGSVLARVRSKGLHGSQSPSCRGRQGSADVFPQGMMTTVCLNPLLAGAVRVPIRRRSLRSC